ARFRGRLEGAAVEPLQRVVGVEVRQHDLGHFEGAAVRVGRDHTAFLVDRDALQVARRIAVLPEQVDLGDAVHVGELGDARLAVAERYVAQRDTVDLDVWYSHALPIAG